MHHYDEQLPMLLATLDVQWIRVSRPSTMCIVVTSAWYESKCHHHVTHNLFINVV